MRRRRIAATAAVAIAIIVAGTIALGDRLRHAERGGGHPAGQPSAPDRSASSRPPLVGHPHPDAAAASATARMTGTEAPAESAASAGNAAAADPRPPGSSTPPSPAAASGWMAERLRRLAALDSLPPPAAAPAATSAAVDGWTEVARVDFSDPGLAGRLLATGPGFSIDRDGLLIDLADGWQGLSLERLLPDAGPGDLRLVFEITPLPGGGELADLTISTGMAAGEHTLDSHWTGHEFKLGGPGYAIQELKHGGQPIVSTAEARRRLATGQRSRVEVSRVGGRLSLAIDGAEILSAPAHAEERGHGIGIMAHRIRARIGMISLHQPSPSAVN